MNGAPLANHTTKYCLQAVACEKLSGVAHAAAAGGAVCVARTHIKQRTQRLQPGLA